MTDLAYHSEMNEHGYTLREFADLIGASIHTVRRAVREGRLQVVRFPVYPGSIKLAVYVPRGTEIGFRFLRDKLEARRQARLATKGD